MMPDLDLGPAVTLDNTTFFDVETPDGPIRAVISKPSGDIPPDGFGIIYTMDAAWSFGTLRDALTLHRATDNRPTLLVALGYPTPDWGNMHRREADLVTTNRDALLRVLVNVVVARVEACFPINPRRRMIMGHSYGGVFAIRAGFAYPELFSHIGAGSPSIWTAPEEIHALARPARILIGVGELEAAERAIHTEPDQARIQRLHERDMIGNARQFARNCNVPLRIWADCNHGRALFPFLSAAPKFLWA